MIMSIQEFVEDAQLYADPEPDSGEEPNYMKSIAYSLCAIAKMMYEEMKDAE